MSIDWEVIEAYAEAHSSPPSELFERLDAETRATQSTPAMMMGPVGGAFLSFIVGLKQPRRALEIGTFTGWSSIAMASALPPGGKLITCDVNPETTAIARRYADEAGVADRIEYLLGRATETVATLDGPFDLVFIDADKVNTPEYFAWSLDRTRPGGLIIADNVVRFGTLADADSDDPTIVAQRRLHEWLAGEERVSATTIQTVGVKGHDGFTLGLVAG
jgi:predicted O-methyltransferase YrrM